ncbi:DUF4190 domain-containing protein [Sinomonas sp. ASV322]|uniref:DUF4190 domain-containing protein n=1 Tax=Sinomonas sp. ASV322 TaxID=3041920 RepID=UPI0027DB2A9F|nr:DUF4190 domain-containing protein [Sinomonas sp. ASV322]MDQ4503423.1 DUF4190 domain-containing protein [Sinomonas sp. ASV322]
MSHTPQQPNPYGQAPYGQQPQSPYGQAPQSPYGQQHQGAQSPSYAQPAPGYVVLVPQPKGASIASMVLGIVSIFFGWTFLAPTIGFVLGIVGLRREPAGRGMAVAGLILNGIMLVGWVLLILVVFGVFGALIGAGMGYSH